MSASKGYGSKGEICSADAIIYPKYPNCKNRNRCTWTSCDDDLGFLKKIIDLTKDYYNINKVYVLGMSNGGMMAQAWHVNIRIYLLELLMLWVCST